MIRNGFSNSLPGLSLLTEYNQSLINAANIQAQSQSQGLQSEQSELQIKPQNVGILGDFTNISNTVLNYLTTPFQCGQIFPNNFGPNSPPSSTNSLM